MFENPLEEEKDNEPIREIEIKVDTIPLRLAKQSPFLLNLENSSNISEEIRAYYRKTLARIKALNSNDVEKILSVFSEKVTGYEWLREEQFIGKEWEWDELESWRKFGFNTGIWLRCFWQKIFRHDFSKDDISDIFDCVSISYIRKELHSINAFYPDRKKNIKKIILDRAEENAEYRELLTKIMKKFYRSQAFKILQYTLQCRSHNAIRKARIQSKPYIKYYWQGVITTQTDKKISAQIELSNPDAIYPLFPVSAFDWQLRTIVEPLTTDSSGIASKVGIDGNLYLDISAIVDESIKDC